MKRLVVSDAVRPLEWSLGVKALTYETKSSCTTNSTQPSLQTRTHTSFNQNNSWTCSEILPVVGTPEVLKHVLMKQCVGCVSLLVHG